MLSTAHIPASATPPHRAGHTARAKNTPACTRTALLACAMAACALQARAAAPTDPQQDEIAHIVQQGDTLEGLARSYLGAPHQWRALQARNNTPDPRRLQPGSTVWIPVRLQPPETASVVHVQGAVTALPRGASAPVSLAPGTTLHEGTELRAGADGFVTVQLADGSVVRVQAQSDLNLRQLRRRGRAGSVQSVLEMRSGSLDTTVPPSAEPHRRMQIRTPQAVTSVRGTRFDVTMADEGRTVAAVLSGSVAVQTLPAEQAPREAAALVSAGQGIAVAADGTLGPPTALLPPPDLSGVPAVLGDAGILAINLPPPPAAGGYVAQLAQDPGFARVVRHGRFADGQLRWRAVEDGGYYLSVRTLDERGIAGLPAVQPLTVKTRPVAPLYQHPAAGAIIARGQGELLCTQVSGVRWYRIQVAGDAAFTHPLRDEQRLAECRLPLPDLPAGTYFWRAASVMDGPGGVADQGPFAPGQAFSVAERPPVLASQSLDAQDGTPTLRLRWAGQTGQRFRLQLAQVGDTRFSQPVVDTLLDAPEWTAADLPAGEYQVRIQVLDPTGLESDFSAPRQVRVGTGLSTGSGLPVLNSTGQPVRRP